MVLAIGRWLQLGTSFGVTFKKSPPSPTPIISVPSSEIRTQSNGHSPARGEGVNKQINKNNAPSFLRVLLWLLQIKTVE